MIKTASPTELTPGAPGNVDKWIFRDRESLEDRFGLELERILELRKSKEGQRELLTRMKEADPTLNGEGEKVLKQVDRNVEQLKKKETFFESVAKFPQRTIKSALSAMYHHPFLTAAGGIAAILALLYFSPALATTGGQYGQKLIDAFRNVMGKLKNPLPTVGTDAVGKVGVMSGGASEAAVEAVGNAYESPSILGDITQNLRNAAQSPAITPDQLQIMQDSATNVGEELLKRAPAVDPFDGALQNLPE